MASASTGTEDDRSSGFGKERATITNSRGEGLVDYIKTLAPAYNVVYRDIGIGYALLIGTLAVTISAELAGLPPVVVALLGAVLIGYWIAYLQLFMHEGAHWGLAPDRAQSDRICDIFIGWMAGTSTRAYRDVHFQHHRALGTTADSETTYFLSLDAAFIVKGLSGIRALEVLYARNRFADTKERQTTKPATSPLRAKSVLIAGVLMNLAIVAGLLFAGLWASALAWVLGVGMFFPFFGALRQLLEHRAEKARSDIDYQKTDHGAVTRMFDGGAFAHTFGGAGFNRHLLHHWEPTVSYTRLRDLENFLKDTRMAPIMESRRTTYWRAFARLIHAHGSKTDAGHEPARG